MRRRRVIELVITYNIDDAAEVSVFFERRKRSDRVIGWVAGGTLSRISTACSAFRSHTRRLWFIDKLPR